jgi:hypothetical protein
MFDSTVPANKAMGGGVGGWIKLPGGVMMVEV